MDLPSKVPLGLISVTEKSTPRGLHLAENHEVRITEIFPWTRLIRMDCKELVPKPSLTQMASSEADARTGETLHARLAANNP